jgi:FkbH-like protein
MTTRIGSLPAETILRKRKALARELGARSGLLEVRIAILGGSTTSEIVEFLELLLLDQDIRPIFYQSEYNRYFEEAVIDPARLIEFKPQIVYLHTSSVNIQEFPPLSASEADHNAHVSTEAGRYVAIWNALEKAIGCVVVQNNFELPSSRILGNLDSVNPAGHTRFVHSLNAEFARYAATRPKLLINDLDSIAATLGLDHFHDPKRWFSYKLISTPAASLEVARSVAAIVTSIYGRARKCLVLDLDNTLWGGVIGDDGVDNIKIGRETAEGEAYTAFQQYCLQLRERGVLLAVCSKNSPEIARQGFEHPESVLKPEHFAAFRVNWEPKHENIKAVASDLNIGLDSLVFLDDNPAEREIVSAQLPMVAVPNLGDDVSNFIRVLQRERYFEPVTLSAEDLGRASQYQSNRSRSEAQSQFASYGEYLDSLEMSAEIAPFRSVYLDRITQLINKTNQFNLTTRRYTLSEVERLSSDPGHITVYGKLKDKFGDNGLVSVIIGRRERDALHIDVWLMSCRVIKRDMELAMFDALVAACREQGIKEIVGSYSPSPKNAMVKDHYQQLGFHRVRESQGGESVWRLPVEAHSSPRNKHITVKELVRG